MLPTGQRIGKESFAGPGYRLAVFETVSAIGDQQDEQQETKEPESDF